MKAKLVISDFTQEDLADFFSTALYGNGAWSADYDAKDYKERCDVNENDCYEDKLAKCLLAGCSIEIGDRYSEGEDDVYGDNERVYWDKENEVMTYPITLKDIKRGLEKAYECGQSERVNYLVNDPGQMDMIDADVLLQIIVYGEVIYG